VAERINAAVVTQGETLDEVAGNIREAAALLMEQGDGEELGLARDATVMALMELETAAGWGSCARCPERRS
jgi:predicted RNase H-like HicB family nuclease